jgi:hypothetical protein
VSTGPDGDGSGGGLDVPTAPTAPVALVAPVVFPDLEEVPFQEPGPPAKPPLVRRRRAEEETKPAQLSRRERKALGRLRARKVRRVVRHIDTWSVLKLSLLFYLCLFVIVMVAGVILWNVADHAGTIDGIEGLFKDLGVFESFTFEPGVMFRASVLAGLILVITATGINVLIAVLFNLISDMVGGIRITVLEEEVTRPLPRR